MKSLSLEFLKDTVCIYQGSYTYISSIPKNCTYECITEKDLDAINRQLEGIVIC